MTTSEFADSDMVDTSLETHGTRDYRPAMATDIAADRRVSSRLSDVGSKARSLVNKGLGQSGSMGSSMGSGLGSGLGNGLGRSIGGAMRPNFSGRNTARPNRTLILAVQAVLILWIVYLLARLFWTVFAPLPLPETAPVIVPLNTAATDPADTITARNPFALPSGPAEVVVVEEADTLQETALNFKLYSTLTGSTIDSAIIDAQNGEGQKSYLVGDNITDDVELVEIRFDEVVIQRAGVREILRIASSDAQRQRRSASNRNAQRNPARTTRARVTRRASVGKAASAANARNNAGQSRNQYNIQQIIRFRQRQKPDGTRGVYLYPGKNQQAFLDAGLAPRDLLVSINGSPPSENIRQLYETAALAARAGSVSLVVERDGTPRSVSIDLNSLVDEPLEDETEIDDLILTDEIDL